jgi:hypothetical protein
MARPTRREFVTAVGLLGVAGTTASASVQQGGGGGPNLIVLGGEVEGWLGRAPPDIRGERNPTLEMRAGERYELVWLNRDGVEHELIIADDAGEDLVETREAERPGTAVRTTFRADERMTEYYCFYHPQSMRGDVEITG